MTLAALGRPWGRRGELAGLSFSSGVERFQGVEEVFLSGGALGPNGESRFALESVWEHRGRLIFKFAGIDSISDAERLQGAEVRIPRAERRALPAGEYYQSDLVGCEVVEKGSGNRLGTVTDWHEYGGPPLLEVRGPDGSFEVPFARSICVEIDAEARRITVDLPEGLIELSRERPAGRHEP